MNAILNDKTQYHCEITNFISAKNLRNLLANY